MFWFNRCEAKMPAPKPITVKTAVLKKPVAVVESKSTPTYMPIIKEKVSLKNNMKQIRMLIRNGQIVRLNIYL